MRLAVLAVLCAPLHANVGAVNLLCPPPLLQQCVGAVLELTHAHLKGVRVAFVQRLYFSVFAHAALLATNFFAGFFFTASRAPSGCFAPNPSQYPFYIHDFLAHPFPPTP